MNTNSFQWMMQAAIKATTKQKPPKPWDGLKSQKIIIGMKDYKNIVIYLPTYLRFIVEDVTKVDLGQGTAEFLGTLYFSFYYGGLSQQMADEIAQGKIVLVPNQMDSFKLSDGEESVGTTKYHDKQEKTYQFIVKKKFTAELQGDVFWSPFELLHAYLDFNLQQVVLQQKNFNYLQDFQQYQQSQLWDVAQYCMEQFRMNRIQSIIIKFNTLYSFEETTIDFLDNCVYKMYDIAPYYLAARFSNSPQRYFPETWGCSPKCCQIKKQKGEGKIYEMHRSIGQWKDMKASRMQKRKTSNQKGNNNLNIKQAQQSDKKQLNKLDSKKIVGSQTQILQAASKQNKGLDSVQTNKNNQNLNSIKSPKNNFTLQKSLWNAPRTHFSLANQNDDISVSGDKAKINSSVIRNLVKNPINILQKNSQKIDKIVEGVKDQQVQKEQQLHKKWQTAREQFRMLNLCTQPHIVKEMDNFQHWENYKPYLTEKDDQKQKIFKDNQQFFKRNQDLRDMAQESQAFKTKQSKKRFVSMLLEEGKFESFHYVHYRISLYKFPYNTLVQLLLPLWLLGFINLFIFFQDEDIGARIASIATLMVAYTAFLPQINASIPSNPGIVFSEILILLQLQTIVLCIAQSYEKCILQKYTPYDYKQDGYFIYSVINFLLNIVIVVIMSIVHKCVWQKRYKRCNPLHYRDKIFRRQSWMNKYCDREFKKRARQNFNQKNTICLITLDPGFENGVYKQYQQRRQLYDEQYKQNLELQERIEKLRQQQQFQMNRQLQIQRQRQQQYRQMYQKQNKRYKDQMQRQIEQQQKSEMKQKIDQLNKKIQQLRNNKQSLRLQRQRQLKRYARMTVANQEGEEKYYTSEQQSLDSSQYEEKDQEEAHRTQVNFSQKVESRHNDSLKGLDQTMRVEHTSKMEIKKIIEEI